MRRVRAQKPPAPGLGSRARRAGEPHCTTRFQNTHGTVYREVLYPWHPWLGRLVAIHAVVEKVDGAVCHCTLADVASSRWVEIPLWMFDRASCPADARLSDRPHVDVAALYALH